MSQPNQATETEMDFDNIPGVDPEAVAPNGVDAAASDEGCEGGACKI